MEDIKYPLAENKLDAMPTKHCDYRVMRPDHFRIMQLIMEGFTRREVEEMLGVSAWDIASALKDPVVKRFREDLLEIAKTEHEMSFLQVVEKYRMGIRGEKLTSEELELVKLWFKQKDGATAVQINLTAEDMVFQILNGPIPTGIAKDPEK